MSICELFKDLRSHADEMISVRGVFYKGREIAALGASCQTKVVTEYNWAPVLLGLPEIPTGEYVWPTAVDLGYSESVPSDDKAVHQVELLIAREVTKIPRNEKAEIWVTVVGKLQVMDHYQIGKDPDGTIRGAGYGHLGMYPGRLVIKTMLDPVVQVAKK